MSYCGALWEQRREIFNRVVFLYSSTRALGFQFPVRVGTVILVCYSVVIFVWRGRGGVIIWGARGPIVPYCPYCPVGWVGCLLVIVMDVGNLLWNLGNSRVSAERPFVLGSSQGCPLFVCPSRPIGRDQDLKKIQGPHWASGPIGSSEQVLSISLRCQMSRFSRLLTQQMSWLLCFDGWADGGWAGEKLF